ncbi:hypothetical protein Tco_0964319 [Tanacetum coccineum]
MLPTNIIYLYVCPAVGSTYADTMADMNIPANDAPAEQALAIGPPTRTDDQILSSNKWVPIGKSNCVLDVQKSQRNPIFLIAMAILKNTNFFKAFTSSSTILAIYIQQFWDTMCFDSSTGLYNCQLDEQWFNLYKDILRDTIDIIPTNDDNPFVAPPSSDTVIEYVNTLGYPNTLRNVSAMSVNALYQPWKAILSMINMCLTSKTVGYDRPRHHVLQILWGKNLTTASRGKKKTAHLLIPNVRYIGKDGMEIFDMLIPDTLLTGIIKREPYYNGYLEHVAEYQRYLDEEHDKADDKTPKPTSSQPSKPTPTPTEPSQKDQGKKHKLVKETSDVQSPAKRSKAGKVTKKRVPKSPIKLIYEPSDKGVQGPAHPVVLREPDSGRIQPLPDVQGKGKEKRRTPMPTEASGHAESPSLDAELALTNSETESDNKAPKINTRDQDEGQAGPNPGNQDEGQAGPNPGDQDKDQAGSNPGDAAESQSQSSHVQMDEEFTTTAYPNVQENLKLPTKDQFFVEKPHEEELGKTNAEAEVQSMVSVPIHQDTSSVPPMTTPVIDLIKSQSDSPLPTSTATISTITTITTTLPPQPQQSSVDLILVKSIGELEQHMADLIQNNLALEERLGKQGSRLYNLENLNIPHKVSQAVDEIVTDAVDWAMQAPLRACFRDLPTKSLELDYSNQRLADQEEARKKEERDVTYQELLLGASGSSQLPPPPPPPSTGTSGSAQQQDSLMHEDSIPNEQVHLSDDEDSGNDHLPKADSRKDWWKPLPKEERPVTLEPAWIIPSSNVSGVENNWASALVSTSETPAENSLLTKTAYEVVKTFFPDVIHLQFQIEKCHKMLTDQVNWINPEGDQVRFDVKRPLPLGGLPGHETIQTHFFFNKDLEYLRYGIKGSSPTLSISKMKAAMYPDFGLELLVLEQIHDSLSRQKEVRIHMRIFSVVKIKAYSRYGYDYLSEIVLRRADFQEHTIAEKDFKNLYPSDFEDLNLLLLQGHLDHLPSSDKRMLSTVVKLWTRNLVIRQRVEDFQLGIESYQTQLNLTKPGWDVIGYEFKQDYTIIESPRAVVFLVNNNKRKIMWFNKIYKFSDGTLRRILEALDYSVKEFKVKRLNPGMNTRFWTQKDVTRSKEFTASIEKRLKTRRIYRNLECFVGGRVRDIDYRLLQRTD